MAVLIPQNSRIRFPIGISNYRKLRQGNYLFVDKTAFIARVIENDNPALLIPRPRRFGKTLNMSMLKFFFEMKGKNEKIAEKILSDIFEDTAIWKMENGSYQEHFQQYPVVFLTFKDVSGAEWKNLWTMIRDRILSELERLDKIYNLLDFSTRYKTKNLRTFFEKNNSDDFKEILGKLVFLLYKMTGKEVILLIDEYDAPLLAANENGYWKKAVNFFKPFISSGFKDQEFLFKGVITGILKIAKESIFSGMNNLDVYTTLSYEFRSDFGFTEDEVLELVELTNQAQNFGIIKDWYNGYRFGDNDEFVNKNHFDEMKNVVTIYNPWSILKHLRSNKQTPKAYWLGTSANSLIRELLHGKIAEYGDKFHSLLNLNSEENCILTEINENLELKLINEEETALWSLLFFSGYLTVKRREQKGDITLYHVCIPNKEVYRVYVTIFQKFLLKRNSITIDLLTHMLKGEEKSFENEFNRLLLTSTSFHDFTGRFEAAYHTFVLGIITQLDLTHLVYSNIEAGKGRVDVLIVPRANNRNGVGVILEFKVLRDPDLPKKNSSKTISSKTTSPEKIEELLQECLHAGAKQIADRKYIATFSNRDIGTIHQYAIAFYKKTCLVKMLDPI